MYNWGKPQFYGVRGRAANIGHGQGNYTVEQFREDYPQFFRSDGYFLGSLPMLEEIIRMANRSIQPDKWLDSWRYAVGLYVAHYAALSLRGYADSNETPEAAAASGALVGVVQSATLGDASVSYDTSALTAGTEGWGDLNATTYGQQLANRAKLIGMGAMYVI
jgi:hypothetical protein